MHAVSKMFVIAVLALTLGHSLSGQCTLGPSSSAGRMVGTTGDSEVDRLIRLEVRRAERTYGVKSAFGFYDDGLSPNANARPGTGEIDGVVSIGVTLVNEELQEPNYGPSALPGIIGHEYAHLLQFQRGTTLRGVELELQADFIAGWYLARQSWKRPLRLKGFASSLYAKGDWNFYSPSHHGTPDERVRAMLEGYKIAERSLDEVFEASEEYVTRHASVHYEAGPQSVNSINSSAAVGLRESSPNATLEATPASPEIGAKIAVEAGDYITELKKNHVVNIFGGGPSSTGEYSDCSHFVHDVLERALGHSVPYVSTNEFASGHTPSWWVPIPKGQAPQLGDLIVQGGHMAIFVGEKNGAPMGAQLGSKAGPSTRAFGVKGYFAHPEDLRFYRVNVSAFFPSQSD